MTKLTISAAAYAAACAALVAPATAVTKAIGKADVTKALWASTAAGCILSDDVAFTIDDAREGLIAAYRSTLRGKARQEACKTLADIDPTLKGWFYDLQRVAKGGLLQQLLEGGSLTGLRRATKPVQEQAKGKRAKAANDPAPPVATSTATPPPVPVEAASLPALLAAVVTACGSAKVPTVAKSYQGELGRAIAALTTLARQVEAHIAAKAKAAPAKAKRVRKAA